MLDQINSIGITTFAALLVSALGCGILLFIILYILDISQSRHAIRRNYPVIGRFRNFFEHLGTFFRQYFFAMDREELPFNRAIRVWIYRAAKGLDLSNAFGSTQDIHKVGEPLFLNAAYPILEEDQSESLPPVIGASTPNPYQAKSYFNISGMSYGALSSVAIRSLSKGAALSGCWLNTGEGGVSEHHLSGGCDIIYQIGTAYYGVRDSEGNFDEGKLQALAKNSNIKMFELKLSQGAKPGKGGILPGAKVTAEIAKIRGITEGVSSISPNRHPHIANDIALLDFIAKLKLLTQKPVGIKFVLGDEQWFDDFCHAAKAREESSRPDFITLDGGDGGSGAAPQALMDFVGMPVQTSLPIVHNTLKKYDLNESIRLICSGKLVMPSTVAWALCNGADFVNSARGFMFSLGCIQAMQCNKNTCPTGITTHNKNLMKGLNPSYKSVRVAQYHQNLVKDVEMIAHSCGLKNATEFSKQNVKLISHN